MASPAREELVRDLLARHLRPPRSGAQMARAIGVSQAAVSRYKSGKETPEDRRAPAIAAYLGLPEAEVAAAIVASRRQQQEARAAIVSAQVEAGATPTRADFEALQAQFAELTEEVRQLKEGGSPRRRRASGKDGPGSPA